MLRRCHFFYEEKMPIEILTIIKKTIITNEHMLLTVLNENANKKKTPIVPKHF